MLNLAQFILNQNFTHNLLDLKWLLSKLRLEKTTAFYQIVASFLLPALTNLN